MNFNVFVNKETALFIGGNPAKGQIPVITTTLKNPQILVDTDKGTIVIIETTGTHGPVIKK